MKVCLILIFKKVKKLLQFICLCILFFSCNGNKQPVDERDSLKFYTARTIDSIVNIIDSNATVIFSKDDTTLSNFLSANTKQHVKDLIFDDSSSRMIYNIEKCGLYCSSLRKFYFKDNQLIKVSFSSMESFSLKSQGAYYYSREKPFLMTTSNRRLPKPEAALEQAKKYLKKQ